MAKGYLSLTFVGPLDQRRWQRLVESFRTHADVMGFPLAEVDEDLDD